MVFHNNIFTISNSVFNKNINTVLDLVKETCNYINTSDFLLKLNCLVNCNGFIIK